MQSIGSTSYTGYSFTGHSLGGGLAQYMTHVTNGVGHAFTFNAVGIGQAIPGVDPMTYYDSITNYVNENDIIGQFGTHLGRTIFVHDTGNYEFNEFFLDPLMSHVGSRWH